MQTTRHGDIELAYEVRTPADRPDAATLLLIMGINMRSAHWGAHFLDALAEDYRVVVFDNRGTGYSTKPVTEITADLWARDALAVLDAVGVQRAHVLGFSMGGRVAQELAVHHPARVDRLILLSSAVGGPDSVAPDPRAAKSFVPTPGMSPEEMRREGLIAVTGPDFPTRHPERLQALVEIGANKRTPVSVLQLQLGLLSTAVTDALPGIPHRTRIIQGLADSLVVPGNAELLRRALPEASFVPLSGVGHMPHWEAPELLLPAITDFLG